MFLMHVVYGLDLIALSMGTGLLVWSMKTPGSGSWLGKLFGFIVMILSIISIICVYSCAWQGRECYRGASEIAAPAPAVNMGVHQKK